MAITCEMGCGRAATVVGRDMRAVERIPEGGGDPLMTWERVKDHAYCDVCRWPGRMIHLHGASTQQPFLSIADYVPDAGTN